MRPQEARITHTTDTQVRRLKLPFYGWAIAFAAMIASFASGPGQSFTFSVFLDPILVDTGLSRTFVSGLFAMGTGVSAATAFVMSRMVDRFGARIMLMVIALAYGAACFGMARIDSALTLLLGFALVRALGQGSLPVTATVLTAQWFVRYRGRAMAMVSLGLAASTAVFPPITGMLINNFGWRTAYQALGVGIWLLVIPVALFIVRDRPEAVGLQPDGVPSTTAVPGTELNALQPRRAVWLTRPFWLLALPLMAMPFIVTALVFHQTSIFAEHGLTSETAAWVFVVYATSSALMTPITGFLIERVGPRTVLFGTLALLFLGLLQLQAMSTPLSAMLYAATLGCGAGGQSVVGGVSWAHYYGRRGLGAVQGSAAMLTISAAAIGPLPLAYFQQFSGDYRLGLLVYSAIPIVCAAILTRFRPPTPPVQA